MTRSKNSRKGYYPRTKCPEGKRCSICYPKPRKRQIHDILKFYNSLEGKRRIKGSKWSYTFREKKGYYIEHQPPSKFSDVNVRYEWIVEINWIKRTKSVLR